MTKRSNACFLPGSQRKLSWVSILGILTLCHGAVLGQYGGGKGTTDDPYQIAAVQDLLDLGDRLDDYDKHFVLTADLDLSGRTFSMAVVAGNPSFVGSYEGNPFTGSLDGRGYRIKHLHIQGADYLGLFGKLGPEAMIANVGLEAAEVNGRYSVGALVGRNDGNVSNCYSTGTVTGSRQVGGLAGLNNGRITNSYNLCVVTGEENVGGLVGLNGFESGIQKSFSVGSVSGTEHVGGLVGMTEDRGYVSSGFWDVQTSGRITSDGGTGLTTEEMKDPEVLGLMGLGNDPNWVLDAFNSYPRLAWEGTPGSIVPPPVMDWLEGSGTREDPYVIDTVEKLGRLGKAAALADRHFVLSNDLDLSGRSWTQAVIPYFVGHFDGQGHVIHHLAITGQGHLGLFGYLGPKAVVFRLGLEAVDVWGSGDRVGGLVGAVNGASVSACFCTGKIEGDRIVGGLVGSNNGRITDSYYSSVDGVNGHSTVGGLMGYNSGRVSSCYSTGRVRGGKDTGGLVGTDGGGGSISNCCWDVQTSGRSGSDGGVGLTTAAMKDPKLLGLNGFANDPNWVLDAHRDYPRLAWEGTPGSRIPEPIIDWLSGDGTPDRPYAISTTDQLGRLGQAGVLADRHFILLNDLNLSGRSWNRAVIPCLTGSFFGNGHVIHHLRIVGTKNLGLFGRIGPDATVLNLGLEAVNISGTGTYVGALAGSNWGSVSDCYSGGTVMGDAFVGGLLGANQGCVTDCYGAGTVTGDMMVGGLVGINDADLTHCYSAADTTKGNMFVGGLVGWNRGNIVDCYSISTATGSLAVGGLLGANRGSITKSHNVGKVQGERGVRIAKVGGIVGDNGGIIVDCYNEGVISGSRFIGGLAGSNNIDGIISKSYNTGDVTGDNDVGGLVAINSSTVSNCYNSGIVKGHNYTVGGLIGENKGTVLCCHSTGTVKGNYDVGGLVAIHRLGNISQCFSTVAVTGRFYVGGLVGTNYQTLSNCYSTGAVVGKHDVGGLVGSNLTGHIANCYSTGRVTGDSNVGGLTGVDSGSAFNSFWDMETSGRVRSAGGKGISTAEMQDINTYLLAGWDFVNESINGPYDIWMMPSNASEYPQLTWETQDWDSR